MLPLFPLFPKFYIYKVVRTAAILPLQIRPGAPDSRRRSKLSPNKIMFAKIPVLRRSGQEFFRNARATARAATNSVLIREVERLIDRRRQPVLRM